MFADMKAFRYSSLYRRAKQKFLLKNINVIAQTWNFKTDSTCWKNEKTFWKNLNNCLWKKKIIQDDNYKKKKS